MGDCSKERAMFIYPKNHRTTMETGNNILYSGVVGVYGPREAAAFSLHAHWSTVAYHPALPYSLVSMIGLYMSSDILLCSPRS